MEFEVVFPLLDPLLARDLDMYHSTSFPLLLSSHFFDPSKRSSISLLFQYNFLLQLHENLFILLIIIIKVWSQMRPIIIFYFFHRYLLIMNGQFPFLVVFACISIFPEKHLNAALHLIWMPKLLLSFLMHLILYTSS